MSQKLAFERTYDGGFYALIGDFQGRMYLEEGFTEGTAQEVAFLLEHLELPPGARLLDVGCGAGRHSLELARRGLHTVGIDLSSGLIRYAQEVAAAERLTAEFHVADARALEFEGAFDAAICLCQGAFGLAGDEAGHRQVLERVSRALRPGSPFVLTAINALSAVRNLDPASTFDPYTLTSSWCQTFRSPEGEERVFEMHCTAFTYRELKWLLESVGFEVVAAYGCVAGAFSKEPLTVEDVEIMMVARKRASYSRYHLV